MGNQYEALLEAMVSLCVYWGVIVADHGCCCMDKFNKMGNQHQGLLEAMVSLCVCVYLEGGRGGGLVLVDQGCCCIEFDKMGSQHQALLEAMVSLCVCVYLEGGRGGGESGTGGTRLLLYQRV